MKRQNRPTKTSTILCLAIFAVAQHISASVAGIHEAAKRLEA